MDAMASDIGILIHTPVVPKNVGNMSKPGIRNKTCRESEKNIAFPAIPIH
jgi:hypothetical protein